MFKQTLVLSLLCFALSVSQEKAEFLGNPSPPVLLENESEGYVAKKVHDKINQRLIALEEAFKEVLLELK